MSMPFYLSLDLETTGTKTPQSQIISLAAVADDLKGEVEEKPFFAAHLLHPRYDFEIVAAVMNRDLIAKLAHAEKKWPIGKKYWTDPEDGQLYFNDIRALTEALKDWLQGDTVGWFSSSAWPEITFAGKNFATFDMRFLTPPCSELLLQIPCHRRVIDPASMYWIPAIDGMELPNTDVCLERAGLKSGIKHNALEDARNVCRLIRKKM